MLGIDAVELVPLVSPVPVPVPVAAVVASELEADGAELPEADPVAEGPVLADCPELAEVPEELKADEVPDVCVPEAEVTDAEPEVGDDAEPDSEVEDELEREELPVRVERKLVD